VRDYLIHGEVHDGNAWALGGVSGHAGLFAPAADVAALAREFLGSGSGLFGRRALDLFRENLTPGLEEGRTVGWRRATPGAREAEGVLPEGSFGHTGFTGTSLWLDPIAGRSYVLLTNRVHPEVKPIDMNLRRRRFHEIAKALA
jgi:CubicO group peptidase (beta-lactamase class C family)